MSVRWLTAAWPVETGSTSRKAVLTVLADHADEDGYCWPKVRTIALLTELTERTVSRVIGELEEAGIISVQPDYEPAGRQTTNIYRLEIPKTPPVSVSGGRVSQRQGGGCHSDTLYENYQKELPEGRSSVRRSRRSSSDSRMVLADDNGSADESPALGASRQPNREAREQAAVESGTSGWGIARRLQLALADADGVDLRIVDVKALARRLNDRHRGGESRETQCAMVEMFVRSPSRYVQGDQKGWTAFLAAAPKLAADVGASSHTAGSNVYDEDPYAEARGRRAAGA